MQTVIDEMGNEVVVVTKGKKPKLKGKAPGEGRVNDNQIALQVVEQWGKPLAYQAGQFWSYTADTGWTVCTNQLVNLANERGGRDNISVILVKIKGEYASSRVWWRKLLTGLK